MATDSQRDSQRDSRWNLPARRRKTSLNGIQASFQKRKQKTRASNAEFRELASANVDARLALLRVGAQHDEAVYAHERQPPETGWCSLAPPKKSDAPAESRSSTRPRVLSLSLSLSDSSVEAPPKRKKKPARGSNPL